jgi:hypothetical protein
MATARVDERQLRGALGRHRYRCVVRATPRKEVPFILGPVFNRANHWAGSTLRGHRALPIPDVQRTQRAALNERSSPMLKMAWLPLDHPVCAAVGYPWCCQELLFRDLCRALEAGLEAEMGLSKSIGYEPTRTGTTLFDPGPGRASKNSFRALSKSGFDKRLRV